LDLDAGIGESQALVDSVLFSFDELNRRERVGWIEADAAPSDDGVRTAYERTVAIAVELDGLQGRLAETQAHIEHKQILLDEARKNRDRAIMDFGFDKRVDELEQLQTGISNYRLALSSFWPALEAFFLARTISEKAWADVEEAGTRERRQKDLAERLERSAMAAEVTRETLDRAAGADFEHILARLDHARRRLDDLRVQEKELRRLHHDTELAVTRVDERLRNRTEMLNGQTDRRDAAASSMRSFARTGLLPIAAVRIGQEDARNWSTARIVEVAFELTSRLEPIESGDPAWEHLQKFVPAQFNELMRTLSAQDCQPSATFCDDVFVATTLFRGREHTIEELHQNLSGEVSARQMLLEAREKEVLENQLSGEVASHLHELIREAEHQVCQMNAELENCPMSTGMKLRFVWQAAEDAPREFAAARQCLMESDGTWSLGDCRVLGTFLQQQIQAVCSQMEGGTWHESLAEALDYRTWHRFGVERYQDGVWKRLTRRTHGTGSGGEKAVALTLPHFAAAAAFYRTADPLAPRLILLDEAFVGIDADMRAKCMGLIHTFDLDFIMTSEREWGCYPTLPGLAVYQLSTRPGIDAIGLTRWVWNGRQRVLKHDLASPEDAGTLVTSTP
jgi:hypothetical protein